VPDRSCCSGSWNESFRRHGPTTGRSPPHADLGCTRRGLQVQRLQGLGVGHVSHHGPIGVVVVSHGHHQALRARHRLERLVVPGYEIDQVPSGRTFAAGYSGGVVLWDVNLESWLLRAAPDRQPQLHPGRMASVFPRGALPPDLPRPARSAGGEFAKHEKKSIISVASSSAQRAIDGCSVVINRFGGSGSGAGGRRIGANRSPAGRGDRRLRPPRSPR